MCTLYVYYYCYIIIYIYIYIYYVYAPNLPTNIMDFRGLVSSIMLMLRDGIPRPIWGFPAKFDSSNVSRVQC